MSIVNGVFLVSCHTNTMCLLSGLARSFGRAAFAPRPFVPRRAAFESLRTARLASTAANVGKIHQVIGAVVDGT